MAVHREDRWDRLTPLTGVIAVVLWVIGTLIVGEMPDDNVGSEYLNWFSDNTGSILTGESLFILGTLLFIWFVASLATALRDERGIPTRNSSLAFAGGALTGFSLLLSAGSLVEGAFREDDLSPAAAQSLGHMSLVFFGGAELIAVILTLAVGLAVFRTRVFPVWAGWASVVLALWLVILPIGWAGLIFGVPIWTLLVSYLLWRGTTMVREAPTTAAPMAP